MIRETIGALKRIRFISCLTPMDFIEEMSGMICLYIFCMWSQVTSDNNLHNFWAICNYLRAQQPNTGHTTRWWCLRLRDWACSSRKNIQYLLSIILYIYHILKYILANLLHIHLPRVLWNQGLYLPQLLFWGEAITCPARLAPRA